MIYKFKEGDVVKSEKNNLFIILWRFKAYKLYAYEVQNITTGVPSYFVPVVMAHRRYKLATELEKILFCKEGTNG